MTPSSALYAERKSSGLLPMRCLLCPRQDDSKGQVSYGVLTAFLRAKAEQQHCFINNGAMMTIDFFLPRKFICIKKNGHPAFLRMPFLLVLAIVKSSKSKIVQHCASLQLSQRILPLNREMGMALFSPLTSRWGAAARQRRERC